jgi:hypothetical protein
MAIPLRLHFEWRAKPELSCPQSKAGFHCYLPAGHDGYHWAVGPKGAPYPWVAPHELHQFPELAGDPRLHVMPGGGFCPAWIIRNDATIECQMRWKHPGPHGAPGIRWRPPAPVYELV